MSHSHDNSQRTNSSQAKNPGNGESRQSNSLDNQDVLYLAQLRYFTVFADIGEHFLAFITGEAFIALATRLHGLTRAAFVPSKGSGNPAALAFCLNMTEKGASDLARRRNLPFVKPGDERIFEFSDVPKKFEKQDKSEVSVAPVKPKRVRRKKT